MLKRFFCLFLALMLPCMALAEYTMAGFDPENTYRDWNTNLFFQRMEEMTGVDFTYQQYKTAESWAAAKNQMTAGDANLPDVLFKAELSHAETIDLLDRGVLVDLKPYLALYCPNLTAVLDSNPEYWDAITLPDGRIGALPFISEQPLQNGVWLNQTWLDYLKLPMPTTAEELTTVLRAFRERDPNQNARADEIPLAFIGAFDLKFLGHAYGLVANDYNIFVENDEVRFMPLEENFRPFVEWLHDLYAEGLIDQDGFNTSDTLRAVSDADKTNVYGGAITTMMSNFLPSDWLMNYNLMQPLTYEGEQVYRSFIGHVQGGTFAVTTGCKNVGEILSWVDRIYTEEISILGTVGQENVDYVIDGDGTWRLTDASQNNTMFSSDVIIYSGGTAPGISNDAFQQRYTETVVRHVSSQAELINEVAERPFPYYALTYAQQEEIAPLQRNIGVYVDTCMSRWVLGELEISDETFAEFENTLNEMGLKDFMAFWQSIYDIQCKD